MVRVLHSADELGTKLHQALTDRPIARSQLSSKNPIASILPPAIAFGRHFIVCFFAPLALGDNRSASWVKRQSDDFMALRVPDAVRLLATMGV
jgi:hypothetical protein